MKGIHPRIIHKMRAVSCLPRQALVRTNAWIGTPSPNTASEALHRQFLGVQNVAYLKPTFLEPTRFLESLRSPNDPTLAVAGQDMSDCQATPGPLTWS